MRRPDYCNPFIMKKLETLCVTLVAYSSLSTSLAGPEVLEQQGACLSLAADLVRH